MSVRSRVLGGASYAKMSPWISQNYRCKHPIRG